MCIRDRVWTSPPRSSPSTPIPPRPCSRSPITGSWATSARSCPDHQGPARAVHGPSRRRMSENFFLDNPDLQLRLEHLDLREVLELKEKGYTESDVYPTAPRTYADAVDSYRIVLEILGEICGERVAPRAAEADDEGAHWADGEVTYAAATLDAIEALRQAELFGAMLSREYGGLNLPESIYQMMVELVARAESGLMTVYGLQEIASSLEEYGDPETKARILPRFARGDVSGAMVLTEADAGSDLGSVATRATLDEATGTWRLNGVKRFITNGLADVSLVLARSEDQRYVRQ